MQRSLIHGLAPVLVLVAGALGVACQRAIAPGSDAIDTVPPALALQVARADSVIGLLRQRLGQRLQAEMARGGAAAAISVCRDEAQVITLALVETTGVAVGRTSARLRNPRNAPPDWAAPHVQAAHGRAAAAVPGVAIDLGTRVGVLRAIPMASTCLPCHGDPAGLAPEIVAVLRASYPHDAATGFAAGDLRGFFWAEVPK